VRRLPGFLWFLLALFAFVNALEALRYLLPHDSQTGWIASSGFLTLGVAWIVATGLAVRFILRGDAIRHRRWMIRSYALTAAAITLRL
jgi:hypothetical protein